jgi:hypothetical protein
MCPERLQWTWTQQTIWRAVILTSLGTQFTANEGAKYSLHAYAQRNNKLLVAENFWKNSIIICLKLKEMLV